MADHKPFMRLYWDDYFRDAGHLRATEHGAYLMLIRHLWQSEKPVPDHDDVLWRVACCAGPEEWARVRPLVEPFFAVGPDGWRHKRVDLELKRLRSTSKKAKNAANSRWSQDVDNQDNSCGRIAGASGSHGGPQMQTTDDRRQTSDITPPTSPPKVDNLFGHTGESDEALSAAIDAFNKTVELCPRGQPFDTSKPTKLAANTVKSVRARLKDAGLEGWADALAWVTRSPFLRGEATDFRISLPWLAGPKNFEKVLNGYYSTDDDRPTAKRPDERKTTAIRSAMLELIEEEGAAT